VRPHTNACHAISCDRNASFKCTLWEAYFHPHTCFAIALEPPVDRLRFPRRDLVLEDMKSCQPGPDASDTLLAPPAS
jgi:hypothetical protein